MFDDWSIWGSAIALGLIGLFIYSTRKPHYTFNKKIEYVHVRSIKIF